MNSIRRGAARRQSSPLTGKRSARPAGKPGYSFAKSVCDDSFPVTPFPQLQTTTLRPQCAFLVRWGFNIKVKTKPWGGAVPPPDGRPRAQVKERVGRTTLLLIVRR
jgi:hypothetical protein